MNPLFIAVLNFLAADTAGTAREVWPKGPRSACKTARVPVAQYVQWLKDLETGSLKNESPRQLVQRLRRLTYSKHTKKFMDGAQRFDLTISGVTPQDDPPLTNEHLKQESLDGLFSTSRIITARNQVLDPTHLWVAADLLLAGATLTVRAGADSDPGALVSWSGDLGGALNTWARSMGAYRSWLEPAPSPGQPSGTILLDQITKQATKTDILGDMDGIILGARWDALDTFSISAELNDYYKDDAMAQAQAKQLNRAVSARRFHYFIEAMEPRLSVNGRDTSPLEISIPDNVVALDEVKDILTDALDDIVAAIGGFDIGGAANASLSAADILRVAGNREFESLCLKFVLFLKTGLATGDAPWPPNSL